DAAVAAAPDYAEAFNQRGFVRFLQEDFDGALADVDRAITLEPKHFAAMSGRAIILMRQGRFRLAQAQLREAVAIHPFLKERAMIVPEAPDTPADPGGIDL
ncbi:tetratricopeptide repeat protein, partial [Aurantimonas coralicida]